MQATTASAAASARFTRQTNPSTRPSTCLNSDQKISKRVSRCSLSRCQVSVIGSFIVVEGRHPEKSDELGLIERFFVRKFALPRGVQPEAVTSSLSSDGALSIQALPPPKRVCPLLSPHSPQENSPARTIPIKIVQTPSAQASPQPSAVPTSTTNGAEAPKP